MKDIYLFLEPELSFSSMSNFLYNLIIFLKKIFAVLTAHFRKNYPCFLPTDFFSNKCL